MMRRVLLLLIVVAVLGAGFLYWALIVPHGGPQGPAFVVIEPGTPTQAMAQTLARAGVIRSEWSFLLARALNRNAKLQAGEYRFEGPASTWQVFNKIARGDIFYYELRVPEGANMFDIAAQLDQMGLMKADVFLTAARDITSIRDIASSAPTSEGYLFPSTYRVARHTTAQQIVREMTNNFRKVWTELGGPSEDVNRVVTLASLVEKETAVPAERPSVASVYVNRLRAGMKLDCDPTTIYAALLQGKYRGTIYRSDLDSTHPYNTYRHSGLPPGPIANPGRESLTAALRPADTRHLFFVAKGDGSGAHVFSENLAQHNAAVDQYRHSASK
jgi:UPF0755 protein